MKEIVSTPQAPAAIGPYSQAVRANGFLFLSGQGAFDAQSGQVVGGDVRTQTERTLKNMEAILHAAGSSLAAVVKTTVFLADMKDFPAMNEIYARSFPQSPPARSTVEVSRLPKDLKVEIDAIAWVGD